MKAIRAKITALKQDHNLTRAKRGLLLGAKGIRAGTGRYFLNKIPIVQWIPAYSPKWLIGDTIAGFSVGIIILPQALIYSLLAGVSIQQVLLASWLPGVIYAMMGTAKGTAHGQVVISGLKFHRY
jgi:sodium-independent sulfate anion transporter 11